MFNRLAIRCFGVPSLGMDPDGDCVTPPRSAFGLLVFLSSFGGCPVAREQVIEALWPETSPDKASSCLTSSLHRLRKFLREIGHNHAVLVMPGGALALALSEKLSLDTALFAHAAQKFLADDTARALPTGMPQDLRSAAPFQGWYAPWALRERARLELLYERCLRVHMQRQIADGAKEAALDTGARLLDHDPLLEDVHEDVIDIHLSQDRRALALRQYQRCAETLRRELDVAPSQRLAAKLRAACGRSDLLAGTCWDQRSDLALGA